MTIHKFTVNYVEYGIHTIIKKPLYKSLSKQLLLQLSSNQVSDKTITVKNNVRIILFNDLISCFEGVRHCTGTGTGTASCLCGKKNLIDLYIIRNVESDEEFITGSVCCQNWFESEKKDIGCQYCHRVNKNKNNKDCNNCKMKKTVRNIIKKWKNYTKKSIERVDFGK